MQDQYNIAVQNGTMTFEQKATPAPSQLNNQVFTNEVEVQLSKTILNGQAVVDVIAANLAPAPTVATKATAKDQSKIPAAAPAAPSPLDKA
jgi:hypothetical protein